MNNTAKYFLITIPLVYVALLAGELIFSETWNIWIFIMGEITGYIVRVLADKYIGDNK